MARQASAPSSFAPLRACLLRGACRQTRRPGSQMPCRTAPHSRRAETPRLAPIGSLTGTPQFRRESRRSRRRWPYATDLSPGQSRCPGDERPPALLRRGRSRSLERAYQIAAATRRRSPAVAEIAEPFLSGRHLLGRCLVDLVDRGGERAVEFLVAHVVAEPFEQSAREAGDHAGVHCKFAASFVA